MSAGLDDLYKFLLRGFLQNTEPRCPGFRFLPCLDRQSLDFTDSEKRYGKGGDGLSGIGLDQEPVGVVRGR